MLRFFRRLFTNQEGVTAIEYTLIAALIAVAAITSMNYVGNSLKTTLNAVSGSLNNATTTPAP